MSLFQSTILQKHTNALDTATVDAAYKRFTAHFHDTGIQENIRNAKEEQYQGEFLIDLFVKVLGYAKNPTPNFNLTTELKNVKDSKKADGAILDGDRVLGVIELKGTSVTDLGKIETQAFGYKNNQPGCVFVITSNFEKLRFYIDNAVDFEEFNLFALSRERFDVLWLCLSAESLLRLLPKQLKEESLSREEQVTKELYKDYSLFRTEVFQNIVAGNPQYDKLTLFKETQKLLDRFLFIFFAEDRLLLPPNSIFSIVQQWEDLRDKYDEYQPLYDRFKKYFGYLNTGFKGQKHDIFAYNGGLFKPDPILDNITIDDDILLKHTVKLSNYDFVSEVSVNILGHIFEHSLNEIEEIQAEIEGQSVDKGTSKRKKDGVFYTPKYITKYIVDNTVGKLCEEKKAALGIDEADYDRGRKRRHTETVKALAKKLDDYRAWLLQLTICDPACGSGAFLNQALEFLIAEHAYVDELHAKLFGDAMVLSEVENSILENNLFGVDINNESVEIAKLSLWLRTAQKGRKLTTLNNNIKCGNSLIEDPAVAGDKAFDWEKEFPQVFVNGGFDVVIGNPPYVNAKGQNFTDSQKNYYYKEYKCSSYQIDLYLLFNEKCLNLVRNGGLISLIEPNAWLNNLYLSDIRKLFLENTLFVEIVNTPIGVFKEATVDTIIVTFKKIKGFNEKIKISKVENNQVTFNNYRDQKSFLQNDNYLIDILSSTESISIISHIELKTIPLIDITSASSGIKEYETGKGNPPQTPEDVKNKPFNSTEKIDDTYRKHLKGNDINRFVVNWQGEYLKYGEWIAAPRKKEFFEGERFIIREIPSKEGLVVCYTNEPYTVKNTAHIFLVSDPEYSIFEIIAILNSKLIGYYFKFKFSEFDDVFPKAKLGQCKLLPISINIRNSDKILESKAKNIITLIKDFNKLLSTFISHFSSKFSIDKLSKNLQFWHELDFKGFLKELKKAKVQLSLSEEAEWMGYFNEQKAKAQTLQQEIDRVDREIDGMVYALYGLTGEEIAVVEGAS